MSDGSKALLVAALAGGYLLGRTKKARFALTVASYVAGRQLGLEPRQLVTEGIRKLGEIPQVAELGEQLRGEVLDAGRKALAAAANHQLENFADTLHDRTLKLESGELEPEEEEEEEGEEEPEGEYEEEEEEPEEEPEERTGRRTPRADAGKKAATGRTAAKKTAPAKKTAAKKTAAKKTTAEKSAAKKAPAKKTTAKQKTGKAAKKAPPKKTAAGRKSGPAAKKSAKKTSARVERRR
ncbi:histone protein [Streptomyces sp. TM32]|uniref:histone protein n=1 Tax=Streptomyces sp. TM32 TaxID=1652669 RepID=UPI0012AB5277|nr:histone protein [Streptomyces sp. TM32]